MALLANLATNWATKCGLTIGMRRCLKQPLKTVKVGAKLLSKFTWERGEMGIDLACMFGNELRDKVWIGGWKEKTLNAAARTCGSEALKLLLKFSWEMGEIGIVLACKLSNECNKVWSDSWRKEILTKATEICKEVALRLLRKRCGSSNYTGSDLAYDNKGFQYWIKIATSTTRYRININATTLVYLSESSRSKNDKGITISLAVTGQSTPFSIGQRRPIRELT